MTGSVLIQNPNNINNVYTTNINVTDNGGLIVNNLGFNNTSGTGPTGTIYSNIGSTGLYYNNNLLTSSTSTGTNDSWIINNLVNSPPLITYNNLYKSTSAIYVSWNYPVQFNVGFINTWLPAIVSLTCGYKYTTAGIDYTGYILNNSTNVVNNHNGNVYITGIVIQAFSTFQTGTIVSTNYPNLGYNINAYYFYDSNLATNVASSQLNIYYKNYNLLYNSVTIDLTAFATAGVPSQINYSGLSLSFSSIPIGATGTRGRFGYSAPQYVDDNDHLSTTLYITNYKITYSSDPSQYRYSSLNTINTPTTTINTGTGTVNPYYANNLYPDSLYTFNVSCRNNINIGYSTPSLGYTEMSPYLLPINMNNITFLNRYNTNNIYSVNDLNATTKISNLLNDYSNWTSVDFNVPIHTINNRGQPYNNCTMTLSTSLNGVSNISGPSLYFNGYTGSNATGNLPNVNPNYINGITLQSKSVSDSYAFSNNPASSGFYLQCTNNISLDSTLFVSYNETYNLNITATFNDTPITQAITKTFNYRVDKYTNPISITYNDPIISNNTATYVSGIPLYTSYYTFSISETILNIGQYFYVSPISTTNVYLSNGTSVGTNTLSNLYSLIPNGTYSDMSYDYTNTITCYNTTKFSLYLNISGKGNNIISTNTNSTNSKYIYMIYDPLSINLINTTFSNINKLTNSPVNGFRVSSGTSTTNNVPTIESSPNISAYNNITLLTNNQELQIVNGYVCTKGYSTNGYLNYSALNTYNITGADYSNLSTDANSYRYITFIWTIPNITGNTTNYSRINFVLNNTANISTSNSLLVDSSNNKIFLAYRLEDSTNTTPSSSTLSSYWIDGNKNSGTQVTSSNYYINNPPELYYGFSSSSNNGSNYTITENLPKILTSNNTTGTNYIYCRIGLPFIGSSAFTHISAYLS